MSALVLLSVSGCALVVRGTQQNIRIDAVTAEGKPIETLECRAANGSDAASAMPAHSLKVKRSVEDLLINCISQGGTVATARIVSRNDMGLVSLAVGGLVSATIDHLSGAAFAYPEWISLVAGQARVYDYRDSTQGPLSGTPVKPPSVIEVARAGPTPSFYRANFNVTASQVRVAATRRTGRDTYNAEKVASTMQCSATPRAVLVEQGGGYEVHQVACATGDRLSIRCNFGDCRPEQPSMLSTSAMLSVPDASPVRSTH